MFGVRSTALYAVRYCNKLSNCFFSRKVITMHPQYKRNELNTRYKTIIKAKRTVILLQRNFHSIPWYGV